MAKNTRLSDAQWDALRSLGTVGREVFAPDASMRSLVTRGLATRRFIGMRWWFYAPTSTGRFLVDARRETEVA